MNRTILTVTGVLSASSLLLVDSAVKGTVLLALAAVVALILRRDSAATRHLVWLLAIVAMLVVPVLSAMLPQWRVLPAWMSSPRPDVVAVSPPSIAKSTGGVIESPRMAKPVEVERPIATVDQRVSSLPDPQPALATPEAVPAPAVWSWNWINALPLVWAIGFAVLMLRLSAARWMLWNSERLATVIGRRVAQQLAFESQSDSATARDPIVTAMAAICSQLGIGRPVTLLIHPHKTIPVVWGILRCRLMLPAAARQWSDEQLQSVLLHELAHIKRRDTIVQLLAQVACALHWFNPLVWFAAWRLDVERERSCDDLVLASGIRPSAYAGHLLDVVTGLSPARWTQACGLAMARKSSLEGRLTAVLGKDLNRRGVSVALAGLALSVAVGIAVPIAMLRAADEWNPPHGAHIGSYEFSAFCIHDGKESTFVIAYQGDFDSTSRSSSNSKARTWTDSVTLTAKKPGIALSFHRTHTAPGKLSITTAPAEGRDLSKPAPPPREFGQKEYDLAKGRVFLLSDNGNVRQLDIATPVVTDQESAKKLAALIAAVPPQERADVVLTPHLTGKLAPETIARLKWGEPVSGLRMALAYPPALGDALLGKKPHFELVVQNVSEKEVHFLASDEAPNPRRLLIREGERIVQGLSDPELSAADWKLQPGQCGVLRLYTKEERDKAGTIPSSAIESDLSKIGRYHAIVQMEIAKAPPGAWTGKLVTGQSRGSADVAAAPAPMHKDARAYYEVWQRYARANGDIPGALVGELAAAVRQFIKYNPTWETVPKLNALLPRLDATHDWKSTDAIALLDEVAGIQDSPLKSTPWKGTRHTIRQGEALPKRFADVPWGEAQPNGLRAAWVLEPGGAEHRIGAALKARLLVQNAGKIPVMVQVPTWHQGWVKANDAKGAEVQASGLSWTTMAELVPVRLAPGECIEINAPGIGLGPRAGMGPWAGPRVGSNVLAKAGDELTLTHSLVPLDGSEVGVSEDDPHVSGPGWWLAHVRSRLNRELPLPADAAERTRLLDRAVRELFATAPSAEETTAFIADKTPDALDALAKRLVARVDVVSFSGKLPTAPAKFRVLAADANADKQPRVVLGPGEYPLSKGTADRGAATLKIVGRPVSDRRTNDTQLLFEATEFTGALPPDAHKLEVPDGWGTWAIVCRPSDGYFYLLHKGSVRKIDYSAPRKVTDTPVNDLPAEFRDEVKRQLDIHEISDAQQAEMFEKPAAPAASLRADEQEKPKTAATELQPKTTEKVGFTAWGKEIGGLQAGLGFKAGGKRAFSHGEKVKLVVRVRNVGKEEAKFDYIPEHFIENPPTVLDEKAKAVSLAPGLVDTGVQIGREANLAPGKEIELAELSLEFSSRNEADADFRKSLTIYGTGKFHVGFENVLGTGFIKPDPPLSKLATGKLELEVKEPEKLPPEKEPFTAWGKEVGGLQAGLGFKADEKRAYTHGEWATLVVRVRNVGKEEVKFEYLRQFFAENPPTITDGKGEPKRLGKVVAFGVHSPREVKLAAGKEIELYEWTPYLGTGTEEDKPKYPYIFGTGKFQVQYEKVLGNSSSGSIKLDPALSKLATGKLELEVMPVAPVQQEAPKPGAQLKPATELKRNDEAKTKLGDLNLECNWEGEKDGVKVQLVFQWISEHQQARWEVEQHRSNIAVDMSVVIEPNGNEAKLVFRKGLEGEAIQGRLTPSVNGTLRLEIFPNPNVKDPGYPSVKDLVLKRTAQRGAKVRPITEQKLKWGEPVNGLRMALAWPPTLGEPGMGDAPEFYLVVQNVSEKAVRLIAGDAAPNPRGLTLFDARPVSRTVDDVPIPGDWLLQPREVAFVRLFHVEEKNEDGRTFSAVKENVVSTLGQYSYMADMNIGKAPAGAWTGKLVTGATRGSSDVLDAGKPIALRSAPPMSWGVPNDGLRGAWRIIGEMRTGGQAKAELWVWNASVDVVKLSWTERADIGLAVMMSDGTNPAREAPVTRDKKDFQLHYLVLPAGQAVKLKEFAVRLGSAPDNAPAGTVSLPLTPGDWTLQAKWSDTRHIIDAAPEWHGVLDTGELKLKVTPEGATVAEPAAVKAKWPPVRQKTEWSDEFLAHSKAVAEARGTPDAKPEDLIAWGAEENGLRAGLLVAPRVTLGGQLPTRMVLRNVTNDVRELGLSLSLNRLTASAQTPDGKSLQVHKTQLRGLDALYKVTLTPGEQVEFEGPPVQFGVEHDGETKKVKMPKYPICGVETGAGKVHVHFEVEAKTGEAVVEVVAANKGADARKPAAKPPGANIVKVPNDQYVKSGFPADELVGEGVMWNDVQNGLSLGYRITGEEWRLLGKDVKVELWVRNPGDKDVKFQLNMRPDIGLRMKLKGEKGAEHESSIVPNDVPPLGEHRLLPPGHALKVKEFTVSLLWPENDVSGIKAHYFAIAPGAYNFHCELDLPGFSATGEGGKQLTPAEGEWTGKLTTRDTFVMVIAPDAPAPKPRIEHVWVRISKDGEVSLDRKQMSLDELKTRAARNAKKWFTIEADEDVPYAKVIEVVEALKASGVTEFSFAEARVGDGKYRVANRTSANNLDDKHGFSMCRPSEYPQFFTVSWPAEGERPACWLRTYPNVSKQTEGKWAVGWEPGTNVLWWVDDSDVGKMTLTDPAHVIVDREGRTNNFSRDFGLPEDVKTEFRRLGFVIGRDKTPGLETTIGGNTGGQSIVSAEFGMWSVKGTVTDADGKPLANVPVRVSTNQELKTEKTDAKGEYRAYFSLPLQLLAHWRGVSVKPVLEGFTERDMAKSGEFNVLLHAGEQPQRVRLAGDKDFQPGPIPRFAENDLLPSQPGVSPGKPGRADFVMLKAAEIIGELVTADGKPAPPHYIAASTPEQRPGHNAAIQLSDDKGHFRLKGIPTNKPVIFTVNPDGKARETSKSSEQKFEQAREHKLRIVLPAEGSGKGPVKIERLTNAASAPAEGAIRGKVLKPDGSFAAGVPVRVDDGVERRKFRGVYDEWVRIHHIDAAPDEVRSINAQLVVDPRELAMWIEEDGAIHREHGVANLPEGLDWTAFQITNRGIVECSFPLRLSRPRTSDESGESVMVIGTSPNHWSLRFTISTTKSSNSFEIYSGSPISSTSPITVRLPARIAESNALQSVIVPQTPRAGDPKESIQTKHFGITIIRESTK